MGYVQHKHKETFLNLNRTGNRYVSEQLRQQRFCMETFNFAVPPGLL